MDSIFHKRFVTIRRLSWNVHIYIYRQSPILYENPESPKFVITIIWILLYLNDYEEETVKSKEQAIFTAIDACVM